MKLSQKHQAWLNHIMLCDSSGAEMSAYAKEHNLNLKQFYQIKYQFRKNGIYQKPDTKTNSSSTFSKVVIKKPPAKEQPVTLCEIVFTSGLVLRFNPSMSCDHVKSLASTLHGLSR